MLYPQHVESSTMGLLDLGWIHSNHLGKMDKAIDTIAITHGATTTDSWFQIHGTMGQEDAAEFAG